MENISTQQTSFLGMKVHGDGGFPTDTLTNDDDDERWPASFENFCSCMLHVEGEGAAACSVCIYYVLQYTTIIQYCSQLLRAASMKIQIQIQIHVFFCFSFGIRMMKKTCFLPLMSSVEQFCGLWIFFTWKEHIDFEGSRRIIIFWCT